MVTFFSNGPAVNLDYKAIRDQEHCKPYRDFLEYLWARYDPSGDGNECFLGDAKKNFRQRFCGGPDFSFEAAGKKYWVEAIVPGAGSGNDKVPFPVLGAANYVPREPILLRYTHALSTKFKCWHEKWVDKNIVSSDDGYIVAINGGAIPDADCGWEYPYIIQSLYPVGVMHSFAGPSSCASPLGYYFILLRNTCLQHPLPIPSLSWCTQYSFQDGELTRTEPSG
jgi:hypothetical protein